jgi:hypothetical protein
MGKVGSEGSEMTLGAVAAAGMAREVKGSMPSERSRRQQNLSMS